MQKPTPTYRRRYQPREPRPTSPPEPIATPDELSWQIGGSILSSLIALLFIPVLFGAVGVMLGGFVFFKGQKPIGFALMVGGVAAAILGVLIGIVVWSSQSGY